MTSPRGSGLVLLMRRNWSRWMSTESVTKAFTGTGKSCRFAAASAKARCWPSTIQPGLRPAVRRQRDLEGATGGDAVADVRAAAAGEPDRGRESDDDRVGEEDLVAVEVVGDLLDVLADLGPLVADQVSA